MPASRLERTACWAVSIWVRRISLLALAAARLASAVLSATASATRALSFAWRAPASAAILAASIVPPHDAIATLLQVFRLVVTEVTGAW